MASETIQVGGIEIPVGIDDEDTKKKLKDIDGRLKQTEDKANKTADRIKKVAGRIGLGLTAAFTAVTAAVYTSLDSVQKFGVTAAAVGLTTEAFTRLDHAARAASIGSDILNQSIAGLYAKMSERDPNSDGALLFKGLGVSARDASGNIRNLDDVILDLADKFSRMEDSAEKTQIAIRLFGESGKQMIPFLNQGRAEIERLRKESDALGFTVGKDMAEKMGQAGAAMARVQSKLSGLSNLLTMEVLPTFEFLLDSFVKMDRDGSTASRTIEFIGQSFKHIVIGGMLARAMIETVIEVVKKASYALGYLLVGELTKAKKTFATTGETTKQIMQRMEADILSYQVSLIQLPKIAKTNMEKTKAPIIQTAAEVAAALARTKEATREAVQAMVDSPTHSFVEKMNAITEAVKNGTLKMSELQGQSALLVSDLVNADFMPYEEKLFRLNQLLEAGIIKHREYATNFKMIQAEMAAAHQQTIDQIINTDTMPYEEKLRRISALMKDGTLDVKVLGNAYKKVAEQQEQAFDSMVSSVTSALTQVFDKSKGVAIASAIVNAYQAISKAYTAAPPPYNLALAAAQAAMSFAQVANIQKTTSGTKSGSKSTPSTPPASAPAGGGSGGGSGGSPGALAGQTLFVDGLNPNDLLSGSMVRDLAAKLIQYQKDGGKVVLL